MTAEVTLVSDPVPDGRGGSAWTSASTDAGCGHRALGASGGADDRLAGEGSWSSARSARRGRPSALRYRHLAGRLEVDAVVGWRPGGGVSRVANGLRRTLAQGAHMLSDRHASLLAGLTLGDDRDQPGPT